MKAHKAYILKTDHVKSTEYAADVARSCDDVGLQYEYVNWYQGQPEEAWANTGVPKPPKVSGSPAAQCCFSGHLAMWKKILDSGEAGIVLEHDGMMLHYPDIDILDDFIVLMGYKLRDPNQYNHKLAGPPVEIVDVKGMGHEGSHAYALTPHTADRLIKEVLEQGASGAIDNRYFLKSRKSKIGLKIMSPTPAIGWIRDSTIQARGHSADRNYEFIESFQKHFNGGDNPKQPNRNKAPDQNLTAVVMGSGSLS